MPFILSISALHPAPPSALHPVPLCSSPFPPLLLTLSPSVHHQVPLCSSPCPFPSQVHTVTGPTSLLMVSATILPQVCSPSGLLLEGYSDDGNFMLQLSECFLFTPVFLAMVCSRVTGGTVTAIPSIPSWCSTSPRVTALLGKGWHSRRLHHHPSTTLTQALPPDHQHMPGLIFHLTQFPFNDEPQLLSRSRKRGLAFEPVFTDGPRSAFSSSVVEHCHVSVTTSSSAKLSAMTIDSG